MKKTIISSLILASAFVSGIAYANTIRGGKVDFNGELVNAACALNSSSQTVQMGQVRTADFATANSTSGGGNFNIELTGCDSSVGGTQATANNPAIPGTVSVGFWGVQHQDMGNRALSLAPSPGSASGVAVQIRNKEGDIVELNNDTNSITSITNGNMSIPFSATYVATGEVVQAGTANATATFTLTYQ